ncbi:MAG: YigZ family protein [Flavobacteriaceae bacterium]|nr:YigZ family protein [Flavobacteriaceae bacterium]
MQATDEFKTLVKPSAEAIFKDRGSKFLGYAYPIESKKEVAPIILKLKESHHKARHWCYAWRLGIENSSFRANDDGEPNNSAGQPIYGQILSFELTNVLIVVVRYFGGTKLGVGGLINAYKTAANLALKESKIINKTIDVHFKLQFDYTNMNKVMRLIKEKNINLIHQEMEMDCKFEISIRKKEALKIKKSFEDLRCIKIKQVN